MKQLAQAIANLDSSLYIKELFDPIQTHAVYGVHAESLNEVKAVLKAHGANRFRVVAAGMAGVKILCFKFKK